MPETTGTLARSRAATPAPTQTASPARFLSLAFPLTWETTLVEVILVMTLVPRLRALDARVMSTASSSMCQTDSRSKVEV
jgi:hypothetical protein